MKKTVLIISYSKLDKDPRVIRQILALKDDYNIITAGFSAPEFREILFVPLNVFVNTRLIIKIKRFFQMLFRNYDRYYWDPIRYRILNTLVKKNFEVVIANDIKTLPLAVRLGKARGVGVLFDAHEYHPGEAGFRFKNLIWILLKRPYILYLCKKFIPPVNRFVSVSEGVAKAYEKKIGYRPIVITNASEYKELHPSPVDEHHIRMIHHGSCTPERRIELMIELAGLLDKRYSLDLMLVSTDPVYHNEIRQLVDNTDNVSLREPVAYTDIIPEINQYDMGIFILPFTNINYKYALPNKFFEFVQARLAIAVGPSPEMASLVKKYNLGIVTNDFSIEEMAGKLNSLTATDIMEFKRNSHKSARELSFESNKEQYRSLIREIIIQ